MIPIYLAALLFGGILIAASLIGGSRDDADHDSDHDTDHDSTHHTDHDSAHHTDHDIDHTHDSSHAHDLELDHLHEAHAHGTLHAGHGATHVSEATKVLNADEKPRTAPRSLLRKALTSLRFWTFASAAFGLSGLLLTPLDMPTLLTLALAGVAGIGVGSGTLKLFQSLSQSTVTSQTELKGLEGAEGVSLLPISPGTLGKVRLTYGGQITDFMARSQDPAGIESKQKVLVVGVEDGIVTVTKLASLPDSKHQREAACQKISQ